MSTRSNQSESSNSDRTRFGGSQKKKEGPPEYESGVPILLNYR